MNWIISQSHPQGFSQAEAVYTSGEYILAKWNHDRCCGWQLYVLRPRSILTSWLAGAGAESIGWTDDEAMRWAETQLGIAHDAADQGNA